MNNRFLKEVSELSWHDMCHLFPLLKQRLFQLELWKSGHALDEAQNVLGWECAEKLEKVG